LVKQTVSISEFPETLHAKVKSFNSCCFIVAISLTPFITLSTELVAYKNKLLKELKI